MIVLWRVSLAFMAPCKLPSGSGRFSARLLVLWLPRRRMDGVTDARTDEGTERWTNGRTDRVGHGDAD